MCSPFTTALRSLQRLQAAVENYFGLLIATRNLDFFTSFYRFLIQLLPAAVVAPLFFQVWDRYRVGATDMPPLDWLALALGTWMAGVGCHVAHIRWHLALGWQALGNIQHA
eukprot:1154208-Pelagomonas_calceolata.AAC.4